MSKVSDIIARLQELEISEGDVEVNVYKSFNRTTKTIKIDDIYFSEREQKIEIGIYN